MATTGTAEEHAVFNRPLGFSFDVRDTFAVPDVSRNAEMLNAHGSVRNMPATSTV